MGIGGGYGLADFFGRKEESTRFFDTQHRRGQKKGISLDIFLEGGGNILWMTDWERIIWIQHYA